jgi:hypothetical protein
LKEFRKEYRKDCGGNLVTVPKAIQSLISLLLVKWISITKFCETEDSCQNMRTATVKEKIAKGSYCSQEGVTMVQIVAFVHQIPQPRQFL